MGIDHPPRNKRGRLGEPSLWADEPTDDDLSLLEENALRGDEPAVRTENLIRRCLQMKFPVSVRKNALL
jgi:hypothetical protein